MSGKQAKRIRKEIYGMEYSPRHRNYTQTLYGIQADAKRQAYQKAKGRNR